MWQLEYSEHVGLFQSMKSKGHHSPLDFLPQLDQYEMWFLIAYRRLKNSFGIMEFINYTKVFSRPDEEDVTYIILESIHEQLSQYLKEKSDHARSTGTQPQNNV